jgi:hypothetical protein
MIFFSGRIAVCARAHLRSRWQGLQLRGGPYDQGCMQPALAPLETLVEAKRGKALPLPPRLARLYGELRMPLARARAYVISKFV